MSSACRMHSPGKVLHETLLQSRAALATALGLGTVGTASTHHWTCNEPMRFAGVRSPNANNMNNMNMGESEPFVSQFLSRVQQVQHAQQIQHAQRVQQVQRVQFVQRTQLQRVQPSSTGLVRLVRLVTPDSSALPCLARS